MIIQNRIEKKIEKKINRALNLRFVKLQPQDRFIQIEVAYNFSINQQQEQKGNKLIKHSENPLKKFIKSTQEFDTVNSENIKEKQIQCKQMTDQSDLNLAITISASVVSPFYYIQMIVLLVQLYKIIKMKTIRKQFFVLFYITLITITLCNSFRHQDQNKEARLQYKILSYYNNFLKNLQILQQTKHSRQILDLVFFITLFVIIILGSLVQVTIQIFKETEEIVKKKLIEQIVVNFCDTFKVLVFSISILMLCYKWYELYLSYFCSVRTARSWIRKYKIGASIYVIISLIAYILSIIYTGVTNDFEGFNYNEDLILPSGLVCFNLLVCIIVSIFYSSKLNQTITNLEKELGTILKKKRFLVCYYMIFILNFLKIALLLTEILYYYFSGEPFKMSFLTSIGYIIAYIVTTELVLNCLPVFLMVFFVIPYNSKSEKKHSELLNSSNVGKINQSLLDENKSTILVQSTTNNNN